MYNKVCTQISESFLYTAQQFEGNLEEYVNVSNFFTCFYTLTEL